MEPDGMILRVNDDGSRRYYGAVLLTNVAKRVKWYEEQLDEMYRQHKHKMSYVPISLFKSKLREAFPIFGDACEPDCEDTHIRELAIKADLLSKDKLRETILLFAEMYANKRGQDVIVRFEREGREMRRRR